MMDSCNENSNDDVVVGAVETAAAISGSSISDNGDADFAIEGTVSLPSYSAPAGDEQEEAPDRTSCDVAGGQGNINFPPSTALNVHAEEPAPGQIPDTTFQREEIPPKPAMSDMHDAAATTLTSNLRRASTDAIASVGTPLESNSSSWSEQLESMLSQSSKGLTYKSSVMDPECDDPQSLIPRLPHFTMHETEAGPVFAQAMVVDETMASTVPLPVQQIESATPAIPERDEPLNDDVNTTESVSSPAAQTPDSDTKEPGTTIHRLKHLAIVTVALIFAGGVVVTLTCTLGKCSSRNGTRSTSNGVLTPNPPTTATSTSSPYSPQASIPRSPQSEAVLAFINNVTLSGRTILPPWATNLPSPLPPEEKALIWVLNDDPFRFSPDTAARRFRLLQRYALRTLWSQWTLEDSFFIGNECQWYGLSCTDMDVGDGVGMASVVTELDFFQNNLTGFLPEDLGLLSYLTRINLFDNSMSGSLPQSVGRWSLLEDFSIAFNSFTGTIPESVGNWTNILSVFMGANRLSGSLPDSIGQWTKLQKTMWDYSSLAGTLPASMGNWINATFVSFVGNFLSGSLPETIGNISTIEYFYVNSNALTGTVPESVAHWSNLIRASFTHNNFTGSLPERICSAAKLDSLDADCKDEVTCSCCRVCT
jgi:hypothetical protein